MNEARIVLVLHVCTQQASSLSHPIKLKLGEDLALKQQLLLHICFYCSSETSQANHPPGQADRTVKRRPQLAHGEFVSLRFSSRNALKGESDQNSRRGGCSVKENILPNVFPEFQNVLEVSNPKIKIGNHFVWQRLFKEGITLQVQDHCVAKNVTFALIILYFGLFYMEALCT